MRGKAGTRPPRGAKRGHSYAQPSGRASGSHSTATAGPVRDGLNTGLMKHDLNYLPTIRAARQAQGPGSLVAFNDAKWAATPEAKDDIEGSSPNSSDASDSEGCSTALSNSVASPSEPAGVSVDEESKRAKEALDKEAEEEVALGK